MGDDMSDEDSRSLAEWAAKDGGAEGGAGSADADAAAQAAEAAKAAEIFAAGKEAEAQAAKEAADATAAAEAEAAAAAEAAKAGAVEPPDDKVAAGEAHKPKKVATLPAWMKDRLAEQTAKQRDAERKESEARARADVAEAELAELRKRGASGEAPPAAKDTPGADFVPRTQVEARAAEIARMNAFNASADQAYFAGKAAYEDWDAALHSLGADGVNALNRMDFQEAALATGAAHDVLYELGSNPDKASEIIGDLKAGRTAKATAAMTRIADAVATRKAAEEAAANAAKAKKSAVSAVPAPIKPVGGSALPSVDLDKADDDAFDSVFAPMMKKLGWN